MANGSYSKKMFYFIMITVKNLALAFWELWFEKDRGMEARERSAFYDCIQTSKFHCIWGQNGEWECGGDRGNVECIFITVNPLSFVLFENLKKIMVSLETVILDHITFFFLSFLKIIFTYFLLLLPVCFLCFFSFTDSISQLQFSIGNFKDV